MADIKLFHVGIKALIENAANQILLLKSPGWKKANVTPHWDIAGGRIEEGQSVLDVLRREIDEETGIKEIINPRFFTAVVSNHEIPFEDKILGLMLMVYKVKIPENSKIKLSDEHIDYEWVDKKEAAKRLKHKYPEEFTKLLEA